MKKKYQPISIITVTLLLGIGAICFWVIAKNKSISQNELSSPSFFDTRQESLSLNIGIIEKLENNFETFQENITLKPILGAYKWYGPIHVQFISENRMLISFEDGHMIGIAAVEYNPESDSFILLKAFPDSEYQYTQNNWTALVKQYGQADFVPENYTKSIWRNGKSETFPDWTKVSENLFIK